MKRKAQPKPEATPEKPEAIPEVIPAEVLTRQTIYPASEPAFTMVPCTVCGSETRSDLTERLCWVCRRLKISAWRDSEPMPAQE